MNTLIINVPHNSKITQQVEMQEDPQPDTRYHWNRVLALELTHDTSSLYERETHDFQLIFLA